MSGATLVLWGFGCLAALAVFLAEQAKWGRGQGLWEMVCDYEVPAYSGTAVPAQRGAKERRLGRYVPL